MQCVCCQAAEEHVVLRNCTRCRKFVCANCYYKKSKHCEVCRIVVAENEKTGTLVAEAQCCARRLAVQKLERENEELRFRLRKYKKFGSLSTIRTMVDDLDKINELGVSSPQELEDVLEELESYRQLGTPSDMRKQHSNLAFYERLGGQLKVMEIFSHYMECKDVKEDAEKWKKQPLIMSKSVGNLHK